MNEQTGIASGPDVLTLIGIGIGIAVAAGAAAAIHLTIGLIRFALFLAVG